MKLLVQYKTGLFASEVTEMLVALRCFRIVSKTPILFHIESSDQNGISQAYYMVEMNHSGLEPLIYMILDLILADWSTLFASKQFDNYFANSSRD